MKRGLGGSGVLGVRTQSPQLPTNESPLATPYREEPSVGPRIPFQGGREKLARQSGKIGGCSHMVESLLSTELSRDSHQPLAKPSF